MEFMQEDECKNLNEFLSENEINQIPKEICNKIKNYIKDKVEEFITAKAVFQTNHKNLEEKITELKNEAQCKREELEECQKKINLSEKYASELQDQLDVCRSELSRVQDSFKRLEKENDEFRRHKNTLSEDNNMLHLQIERRDLEIERMRTDITSLSSQLQSAVTAKCQAFAEMEEVRSRETALDYREKRLEQERNLLTQQIANLEEELSNKTTELQKFRSEASSRELITNTRLAHLEEELKISNQTITQLRDSNSTLQRRCDELSSKLEEQRNHELTMHASYQEEITAQSRLADLYKGISDEANAKANEYSNAVKELQELLEHATEQYGILESKYNQNTFNYSQEIADKEKKINEYLKELELANELLTSVKQERLNEAVEQLAPTAAIASKILKKGLSLTQIYTQLVEATNELNLEREENEKLKSQMEVILKELEEKAPILLQQHENYEVAKANITSLTLKLDELVNVNKRLQDEADEAKRLTNHHIRENRRLKTELADLARQVCYLLKEVQETRTGNTIPENEQNLTQSDELASSQIISKKLVTFKDIESLQENNQKLLSIVRTLSSRQEEIEKATDQINSGEMKEKLDRYIEQLSDMQLAQDRQTKMLDSLLKQRDMYKNMYQKCISQISTNQLTESDPTDPKNQNIPIEDMGVKEQNENKQLNDAFESCKGKLQHWEEKYNEITNEFSLYKKEKIVHEQMMSEEIERLRKDAETNSNRCCRLKAQLDSANERFSLLQANVVTYKSQIKTLEEKCSNYSATIGKHEQSLMLLKSETLTAQSRLSKAEVQLESLKQERQLLRESEGRLLKEREVLMRERHTHVLLKADMEAIKTSLERVQAEGQLRTEQRLDDATRECAALRRRLQEEQDRFRELTSNLERQVKISQDRLDEEKKLTQRIQEELDASRSAERVSMARIEELNNKLREVSTNVDSNKSITGNDYLNKKIKDMEIQIISYQTEIKSLSDQLRAARFQCQQYCDIAESAESQLRESTDQFEKSKEEIERNLNAVRNENTVLKEKLKQLENRFSELSSGAQESDSDLKLKLAESEKKLEEFDELKKEIEILKRDLHNVSITASVAEDKYAREMVLHSADLQILTKLKEENQANSEKIAELIELENSAKEALLTEKSTWRERESRLVSEIQELQKRIKDLDEQNLFLHNQIQELSERTVVLHDKHQTNLSDSSTSFDAAHLSFHEEDSKSVEQLLQIMKYLRREKDLTIAKFDVLKTENTRLKSQVEVAEKRLQEMKSLLNHERENSEINIMTTSMHSELLRKVETLNAITDSNKILREERDSLNIKVQELVDKLNSLSEEIIPLREKSHDMAAKNEILIQENNSLKAEALRWRQRANTLVERAHKASPEDWRRLQTERENLSKLLTSEREVHLKSMEELTCLKTEKSRLEEQINQLQNQLQIQEEEVVKLKENSQKLNQDLNESIADSNIKARDLNNLRKEIMDKDTSLADLKNKEIQIRKIAKKYKAQYEELAKSIEKSRIADNQETSGTGLTKSLNDEDSQIPSERESQLREEGRSELRQVNVELSTKIDELNKKVLVMQSESENLKKEIDIINKASIEKEERAKQVLKGARTKIMQLTEYKKICEKEMHELKEKLESSTSECESNVSEYEARIAALKSQMESRISRLEHERSDLQAEKEALTQRAAQLQRQLAGQNNLNTGASEPPTANIKPMSARTETPLASIRPMSVVVQSRTAAVLPTTAGAPLLLTTQQSQQQTVHTTETSSPTSSHVDYQPASTSRQLLVTPQINESAESTQREDSEILDSLPAVPSQQQQSQQQTVALVSPRVEQQQLVLQQQQQQQQSSLPSDQQQTAPSSSTQSVSTSHTPIGHKRQRVLDSSASGSNLNENIDHTRQEQISSPKNKRSKQQDLTPTSAPDIEYQVPTSSQRDQDEEGDDGCVVIVDCDEGGGTNQPQEEFDNDPYEEMEEELPYSVEVEGDNNEVEIIISEESANVEVSRQIQSVLTTNQQQQSETISSAGPAGESTSFTSRSSRGVAPMPRQQAQHFLLTQQGYEDVGDDCIVPSTPTLFMPRRNDGFGEAVSSPQVPQGRFTFNDTSIATSASTVPSSNNSIVSSARNIFTNAASGLAQVVQEGMDDTRVDLSQLDDGGTGRSVPTTPQQVSPSAEQTNLIASGPVDEQDEQDEQDDQDEPDNIILASTESQTFEDTEETNVSREPIIEEQNVNQTASISESDVATASNDNVENKKRLENVGTSGSAATEEDTVEAEEVEVSEEAIDETIEHESKDETREAEASPSSNTRQRAMAAAVAGSSTLTIRGATARRSARTTFRSRSSRPTPIVWDNQSHSRGQNIVRGNTSRGTSSEGTRIRGARGRRIRSKFPYNY